MSEETNIAQSIAQRISGRVIASDGTVYWPDNYSNAIGYYIRFTSKAEGDFWENITRTNYGWLVFTKNNQKGIKIDGGMKTLYVVDICYYFTYNTYVYK